MSVWLTATWLGQMTEEHSAVSMEQLAAWEEEKTRLSELAGRLTAVRSNAPPPDAAMRFLRGGRWLTGARPWAQENAALKAEVEHSQKNAPMTAWADRIEEMNRKVMRLSNIHSALTEKEEVRCCPPFSRDKFEPVPLCGLSGRGCAQTMEQTLLEMVGHGDR